MKVGLMLPQAPQDGSGGTWREISALARLAEDGGADSVWVCDHFLYRPPDGEEAGYHEPWTLISALAATTSRIEIGALVLATSFRPAGLLAKMAATANDVAEGRLILGLGCGWHEPEYRAFGYPFDHRVGRFEEALEVIVPLLRGARVTFAGRWTTADDAVLLPPPRTPRILIAAKRDRMLRLAARHADQWQIAWFDRPDERWRGLLSDFRAACEAEGRDPATVELTVGVDGGSPPDAAALAETLGLWAEEGIGHLQVAMDRADRAAFDTCLEAIRQFRG